MARGEARRKVLVSVGGLPSGSDEKKCIRALCNEFNWEYVATPGGRAHPVGQLLCTERSRDGCQINVYGTGNNTARALWRAAKKCTHGCRPDRRQW